MSFVTAFSAEGEAVDFYVLGNVHSFSYLSIFWLLGIREAQMTGL